MRTKATQNASLTRLAQDVAADIDRAQRGISELVEALQKPLKPPFNGASNPEKWRAQHRSGLPPKIEADAELRAFILDRIKTQTCDQIVVAVRAAFPPERRVSQSPISRWWRRFAGAAPHLSTG